MGLVLLVEEAYENILVERVYCRWINRFSYDAVNIHKERFAGAERVDYFAYADLNVLIEGKEIILGGYRGCYFGGWAIYG